MTQRWSIILAGVIMCGGQYEKGIMAMGNQLD